MSSAVTLEELQQELANIQANYVPNVVVDTFWLLITAVLVFFMQVGFAMLEVGSVSPKNTKAVLIKNVGDAAIGAVCWWLVGYGFAFGVSKGGFIGTSEFALQGEQFQNPDGGPITPENGYKLAYWFFNWAFAATSATIVSGAIAERVKVTAYIVYSVAISSLIYPVVVHWLWSSSGWLSSSNTSDLFLGCGAIDFAGSGVVHMVGGTCSLVAAIIAKPRARRFNDDGTVNKMPQQSPALQTLGTLILWCGWYGFNGGSSLTVTNGRSAVAAKAMVSTTIAPSAGAMTLVVLVKLLQNKFDSSLVNNGILAGLVAVTAGCALVEPEGALFIGATAGIVYFLASKLMLRLRIDDVVDATPVHLFCGCWGLLCTGFFATPGNYEATYPDPTDPSRPQRCCGVFYGCSGRLLAAQIVAALCIAGWVCGTSIVLFLAIKYSIGLRVSLQEEETGMDKTRHGRKTSEALRKAMQTAGIDASSVTRQNTVSSRGAGGGTGSTRSAVGLGSESQRSHIA